MSSPKIKRNDSRVDRTFQSVRNSMKRVKQKFTEVRNMLVEKNDVKMSEITRPYTVMQTGNAKAGADGLSGIPQKYHKLFQDAGISYDEIAENKKEALVVGDIYLNQLESVFKFNTPLRSRKEVIVSIAQGTIVFERDPMEVYDCDFDHNKIGSGGFGEVYICRKKKNGKKYAMKVAEPKSLKHLLLEIQMHAKSKHENIVKFVEAFKHENKYYILLELMASGSLTAYVHNLPNNLRWREEAIAYVLRAVLKALSYLHNKYRLHRDIKADNILLGPKGQVKITDFGFAIALNQEEDKRKSYLGTPFWMAPEILARSRYDAKVDVWSTGITTIEICEGVPPLISLPPMKAMFYILKNDPPQLYKPHKWSKELNHFVTTALAKSPQDRPSTSELLMHQFVSDESCCTPQEFTKLLDSIRGLKRAQRKKRKEMEAKKAREEQLKETVTAKIV